VFGREPVVALLPTAHPLTQKKALELTDLANERFVLGTRHSWEAFRHHFFSICHRAGFAPTIAQEASTSDGIIGLVAANMGVSIYPECIRNIQRNGLCTRPLSDRDTAIDMVVCWRSDTRSPSVDTFISELKASKSNAGKMSNELSWDGFVPKVLKLGHP